MAQDSVSDDHEIDQANEMSVKERLTALEEQNQELKDHTHELEAKLEQQQNDGFSDVTRRGALGVLGGGALLGAAGSASAQGRGRGGGAPFADEDHDHSGDYLGEDQPVDHIDTDNLHTGDLAGVKVVGPDGYDSVQAAHDDLPSDGGRIMLTKDITETDIVFTKRTKLVGSGAGLAAGRTARIDSSGGNGLHLKTADCTVRDVQIVGDKTGGYGLKLGVKGEYRGRYTVDNVAVHNKGSHGVLIVGAHLNDKLDINARNVAGNGWHWDHDWFNENLIERLGANRCDGKGVHIEGNAFIGNTVNMLWCEDNADWGMYVADGTNFSGNVFTGYGIEEADEPTLYMPNINGNGGNVFHIAVLNNGEIKLDESDFGSLIVSRSNENFWRNDSPVKLGNESSHFTTRHTPGDPSLEIRSDTEGLIGTIDKQGNVRVTGDLIGNAASLYDPFAVQQQTLAVDGNLAEVLGSDGLSLSKDFTVYSGKYTNGGTVWWRWDQNYLYLTADLIDDEHVQDEPPAKMWKDDVIQAGVSSGRPGEADIWDEFTIGLRQKKGPAVSQAVYPESEPPANPGVLESAKAAITRTDEGQNTDGRVRLTVSSDNPVSYDWIYRDVTVNFDKTPYLSITVPEAAGGFQVELVGDDGRGKPIQVDSGAGTFTANVSKELGWSGKKTFKLRILSTSYNKPLVVDSIGFYESAAAKAFGWEDEFTSLSEWSVRSGLNAEIVSEAHTRYEVALPWSELTANPSDEFVSLALAIHDTDSGGNTGWIEWGGGILGGKNNELYNIAKLVDGSN